MTQPMPSMPTVILLAAGSGSRFHASGGQVHKLDALLEGVPVLERSVEAVRQSGLPWHLVGINDGGEGMGDSIAAGVRATASAQGWLIIPADLPLVRPGTLVQVAQALAQQTHEVVVPFFERKRGHPVGFAATCFDQLVALAGDKGAATIVRAAHEDNQVLEIAVDDEGAVTDIDTLKDLERAAEILRSRHNG